MDGEILKYTFRRCENRLVNLWLEVVQLASTIVFSDDEDTML